MEIFLQLETLTGDKQDQFVGPFFSKDQAVAHQEEYGPIKAVIVYLEELPCTSFSMTPQEHLEYINSRR